MQKHSVGDQKVCPNSSHYATGLEVVHGLEIDRCSSQLQDLKKKVHAVGNIDDEKMSNGRCPRSSKSRDSRHTANRSST